MYFPDYYLNGWVKRYWREWLDSIVAKITNPLTATVCFLPGPRAYELSVYVDRRFQSENLIALEYNGERKKQLVQTGLLPSNNVVQQDSGDFIKSTSKQFDVISLDTENMFDQRQVETVNTLFRRRLLKASGVVVLNYFEGHTNLKVKEFLFKKSNKKNLFEARRFVTIDTLRKALLRNKYSFQMQCVAYNSPSSMFTVAGWYEKKADLKSTEQLFQETTYLGSEHSFLQVKNCGINNPADLRKISSKLGLETTFLEMAVRCGCKLDPKQIGTV